MAELIESGPNKGYYSLPGDLRREHIRTDIEVGERDLYQAYREWQESLSGGDLVWHRYSPGPDKRILGFNRSYLPYIDGYYYVRRDPRINLRKQLFALENKLVPSSGNTEVFNNNLSKVIVPDAWCPYYLTPCPDELDWCRRCADQGAKDPPKNELGILGVFIRWLILGLLCFALATGITALI